MCLQTMHWRFCGHHTTSWEFCHHSKVESILVHDQIKHHPPIGQQLSDNEFHQHLEKLDLAYDGSSPASSPTSSTSSSPAATKSAPASPPTSATFPQRTPSPPTSPSTCFSPPSPFLQTNLNHTTIPTPTSIRRANQRMPCTRPRTRGNSYSQSRSFSNLPDGCDCERIGQQWSVCGREANRTMTYHKTLEAWPLAHEHARKEMCGHQLCGQCQSYELPRIPVFDADIMDWA